MEIHNLLIIDESGSMMPLTHATVTGVNETLATVRAAQAQFAATQQHYVTIVTFDTRYAPNDSIRTIVDDLPIEKVNDFTSYHPGGATPLFDAVGISLTHLAGKLCDREFATGVVTIITDGMENASRVFSFAQVKELIERLTKSGWTFSYMGANHDVATAARSLSITNSMEFAHTAKGVGTAWKFERSSHLRQFKEMHDDMPVMSKESVMQRRERMRGYNKKYYSARVTPAVIDSLLPNQVFVFGSDTIGSHSGGAAAAAVRHFGAVPGCAEGLQGRSYAIPTVGLDMPHIAAAVARFVEFARVHLDMHFLVTPVGCGTAGWSVGQIAPLFVDAVDLSNVSLPLEFWRELKVSVL